MLPFAFLPSIGGWEMILVAMVCLLIFGNRLPSVMRSLGKSVTELFPTTDEARTVGFLTERGNDLAFRRPLIRAALYDEMPVAMRAAWHRDASRALAQAGAPADQVARQLLRAVGRRRIRLNR